MTQNLNCVLLYQHNHNYSFYSTKPMWWKGEKVTIVITTSSCSLCSKVLQQHHLCDRKLESQEKRDLVVRETLTPRTRKTRKRLWQVVCVCVFHT